jgi:O-antigen/teichoic acid export membrane protein
VTKSPLKSQFLKSSSWSFLSVVFRAIAGLTVNKLFALFLGTNGIALLAHFQNLSALFTQFPNEGVNRSIMKYWSDPKMEESARKRIFQSGFWVSNVLMLIVFGVMYWQKSYFFERFINEYTEIQFFAILIPSVSLMIMTGLLNSVILARRDVKAYAFISIVGMIMLVATVYLGVTQGTMDQALLSFVVGYAAMFFASLGYFILHRKTLNLSIKSPDKDSVRKIWSFIIMAVSSVVFGKLLDFGVREYILELYGEDRTGLWQSVAKMSGSYILVFTGTIGVVYYPKMASLIHEPRKLRSYVLKVMGFVTFISIICLGVYYLNKEFILELFFADGFERAGYLVRYQASGDFFALISYLLAYLLSAQVATWRYIAAQAFSAGLYVLFISLLLEHYNLEALTLSYMLRYIGFFFILVLFNRKLLFK